jgi:hypothetical protein
VATLLLVGCGASSEAESTAAPRNEDSDAATLAAVQSPTPEQLHGQWRWDYVTAGAVQMGMVLDFDAGGVLNVSSRSMNSLTEPATVGADTGVFELSKQGTVRYRWGDGSRNEWEHSLTLLENPDIIYSHPCCRPIYGGERYWTHRGYLARDAKRKQFERVGMKRVREEDGNLRSSVRTQTNLTFSAPPAELLPESECTLEVNVAVAVTESAEEELREYRSTFACRAQAHEGAIVITLQGFETIYGTSLVEAPFNGRSVWRTVLDEDASVRDWSDTARIALSDAFDAYLAFDPARPEVLFHSLESNSSVPQGFAWVTP